MSKPICVIAGDVHFTPGTLELATDCINQAKRIAKGLGIPLVLNGDTLDTKAIIRGEVANRLIELFEDEDLLVYVNTGNHDLLSEKGQESSLNFLKPYVSVISRPVYIDRLKSWMIPYISDTDELTSILKAIPHGSRLIVHQGVQTAYLGHYVQDKTSLPPSAFANFRTIGSHYHRRQDIVCGEFKKGNVGLFSYIGNPYSLSFAEAADGPKGFSVLFDDGTLELMPTGLRQHIIVDATVEHALNDLWAIATGHGDLVWLKITGPQTELDKINKKELGLRLFGHANFKLDKLPTDTEAPEEAAKDETEEQLFDRLIDSTDESADTKSDLKSLWRAVIS